MKLNITSAVILSLNLTLSFAAFADEADNNTSYIDQYFSITQGQVPNDYKLFIEDMFEKLKFERASKDRPIGQTIRIPLGRSLQKDASSFEHPRYVTNIDEASLNSPMFIGYATQAKQLEIISWNPYLKQYDFRLVKDFAPDMKPRLVKPPRELCLACHQAGGPILTRFPWSETDFNPKISAKTADELNFVSPKSEAETFEVINLTKDRITVKEIEKTKNTNNTLTQLSLFNFDDKVRLANRKLQAINICKNLCGNNLDCKKTLLLAAIFNTNSRSFNSGNDSPLTRTTEKLKTYLNLKKNDFSYHSSVLVDRNPLISQDKNGEITRFIIRDANKLREFGKKSGLGGSSTTIDLVMDESNSIDNVVELTFQETLSTQNDIISSISSNNSPGITDLKEYGNDPKNFSNPLSIRPKIGSTWGFQSLRNLSADLSVCYGFSNDDIQRFSTISESRIEDIVNNEPEFNVAASLPWPTMTTGTMPLLNEAFERSYERDRKAMGECKQNELPKVLDDENLKLAQKIQQSFDVDRITSQFQKYCVDCHGKDTEIELPLSDLKSMREFTSEEGHTPLEQLRLGNMPPKRAKKQPSQDERQALIKALEMDSIKCENVQDSATSKVITATKRSEAKTNTPTAAINIK